MKCEITKGSEKDFEGAPEWAEVKTRTDVGEFWLEKHCLGGRSQLIGHDYTVEISSFPSKEEIIAERRPITEPVVNQQLTTEWDGEGLPPEGVECEWLDNREAYVPVKIMYSSKDAVVIRGRSQAFNEDVDIPLDPVFEPARCKFRPIRSPEDVARDDFIKKLSGNVIEGFSIGTKFAAALYEAGYRRTKPHADEVQECEHNSTRPTSGGCICNECGWTSW